MMKKLAFQILLIIAGVATYSGSILSQERSEKQDTTKTVKTHHDTLRVKTIYAETIHADTLRTEAGRAKKPVITKSFCSCLDTIMIKKKIWCDDKFEFRGFLFSDLVGINDDQPNGLLQTNAYFCYTRPVKAYNNRKKQGCRKWFPISNVVLLDITISKIGNNNYVLPVRNDYENGTGYVNRYDLVQYSHVISATKINLITFKWHKVLSVYVDFSTAIYNTFISDSLNIKENLNLSTIAFGGNAKLITETDKRTGFSAEISYSIYKPILFSDYYSDMATYQDKESYDGIGVAHEKYPKTIQFIDLRIRHKPDGAAVSSFLRFALFGNMLNLGDAPGNVFFQFQIGASFNFSDFKMFNKDSAQESDEGKI